MLLKWREVFAFLIQVLLPGPVFQKDGTGQQLHGKSLLWATSGFAIRCLKLHVWCWGICNALVIRNCSIYTRSNCVHGVWCVVIIESSSYSKAFTGAQDLDMYCATGEILKVNSLLPGVAERILNACICAWVLGSLVQWFLSLQKKFAGFVRDISIVFRSYSGGTFLSTALRPCGASTSRGATSAVRPRGLKILCGLDPLIC